MKILLVNSLYPPHVIGGAERSVHQLKTSLEVAGHTVWVSTLRPPGLESPTDPTVYYATNTGIWPFAQSSERESAISRAAWHAREMHRVRAVRELTRLTTSLQPDVVHTNNIAGFSHRAWAATSVAPIVHTLRDYYLLCSRTTEYRGEEACNHTCTSCRIFTTARRNTRSRPDIVVGVSRYILGRHANLPSLRDLPAKVIPNQVDEATPATLRAIVRARSSRRPGITVYGFMGRLEQAKGLPVLLSAFDSIRRKDIRLLVAGSGRPSEVNQVVSAAKKDQRIQYIGEVEPARYYEQIDFSLVPTQWQEPYGRVASEALEHHTPVAVSKTGGLPESVGHGPGIEHIQHFQLASAWANLIDEYAGGRARSLRVPTKIRGGPSTTEQYISAYQQAMKLRNGLSK